LLTWGVKGGPRTKIRKKKANRPDPGRACAAGQKSGDFQWEMQKRNSGLKTKLPRYRKEKPAEVSQQRVSHP